MTINLSDYEAGTKYDGDYSDALAALQERLAHIQVAHIVHKKRAVVLLEGWDAAGKGGIVQRLCTTWDPRNYQVWPIKAPHPEELARHFLWRFWKRLPADGNIAVFDRSWYGRVLVERVEGYAKEADWRRGYDEINEFEAQQVDSGTTIVKLFVHTTQAEQDARLLARLEHPWKRWKTGLEDYRNREKRDAYLDAMTEMFRRTDTRWAPWHAIDGNNKKAARIAALTIVADALEAAVDMTAPPLDPAIEKVARKALGKAK
ncbi:polyphosphate kinase 2 family protein [Sphingomonas hylomeconis]|uniref:Polyphosphate kinase 2 family protein n=1 Tax=Sphingomonas hylomeconis TaxID=1395958 RepID=A0ABV7SYN5_9SPHN|nr:polyphosphate kinase [Sphingomonas hylomeconis]